MNIAELFARDPREHTRADIDLIIKTCREARTKFIANPGAKARSGPKLTDNQNKLSKLDLNIKL